jgi:hypothetical protein
MSWGGDGADLYAKILNILASTKIRIYPSLLVLAIAFAIIFNGAAKSEVLFTIISLNR